MALTGMYLLIFIISLPILYFSGLELLNKLRFKTHSLKLMERLVFSFGLIFGVISIITLILGSLGLYYKEIILLIFAILTAIAVRKVVKSRRKLKLQIKMPKMGRGILFGLILTGLILVSIIFSSLAPPDDQDSYHTALPQIYIREHKIVYVPTIYQSHFPQFSEMIYTFFMIPANDILANLLWPLFSILTLLTTFILGKKVKNAEIGILAVIITASAPLFFTHSINQRVEAPLAFYTMLALISFFNWLSSERSLNGEKENKWLYLCGVFSGFCFAMKYTGIIVPAIIGYFIIRKHSTKQATTSSWASAVKRLKWGLGFALISGLTALPWYLKSVIFTGNPFWPYFGNFFPIPNWSETHSQNIRIPLGSQGIGSEILKFILKPLYLFTNLKYDLGPEETLLGTVIISFLPLLLIFRKKISSKYSLKYLLLFTAFYYLFWSLFSPNRQYIYTALPIISIPLAVVLKSTFKHRFLKNILLSILFLNLGYSLFWSTLVNKYKISYALGKHNRSSYYKYAYNPNPYYEIFEYANGNLSKNDKAALINPNARTYDLKINYVLLDPHLQGKFNFYELSTKENVLEKFKKEGISHIIFERPEHPKNTKKGLSFENKRDINNQKPSPTPLRTVLVQLAKPRPQFNWPRELTSRFSFGETLLNKIDELDFAINKFPDDTARSNFKKTLKDIIKNNTVVERELNGWILGRIIY